MPTRADIEASTPRCGRLCGAALASRKPCDRLMYWVLKGTHDGMWICAVHGPTLSGTEAAMRAGYLSVIRSEAA